MAENENWLAVTVVLAVAVTGVLTVVATVAVTTTETAIATVVENTAAYVGIVVETGTAD